MRRAVSINEACEALGVSRTTMWRLLTAGELGSFHVGRRRLIAVDELDRFIAERQAAA